MHNKQLTQVCLTDDDVVVVVFPRLREFWESVRPFIPRLRFHLFFFLFFQSGD